MPLAVAVPPGIEAQRDPALQAHPGGAVAEAPESALSAPATAHARVPVVRGDGHGEVSRQTSAGGGGDTGPELG